MPFGRMGLGLGMGGGVRGASLQSFDAATLSYFDAIQTAGGTIPSSDQPAYDDFVTGRKAQGSWSKILLCGFVAGANETVSLRDIRDPTKVCTKTGGPAFTAYQGYTGDALGARVNLPATPAGYTQNSAGIFVFVNGETGTSQSTNISSQDGRSRLSQTDTSDSVAINTGSAIGFSPGTGSRLGSRFGKRTDANSIVYYANGASVGSSSANASTATSGQFSLLVRATSTYSADRVCGYALTDGTMTDADVADLHSGFVTLMTALSVPFS